jgi:hypothetical protein
MIDKDLVKVEVENLFSKLGGVSDTDVAGKAISEAIQGMHRTHQQSMWRAIFAAAKDYGMYAEVDGRNQASREACNDVTEVVPALPYI